MSDRARLDVAMLAFVAEDNAANRAELLRALSDCELIFPAEKPSDQVGAVRLAFVENVVGNPVLPAFTSDESMRLWSHEVPGYARANSYGFIPAVLSGPFAGLVLNPGSAASVYVDRRALELLSTSDLMTMPDTQGLIGSWR